MLIESSIVVEFIKYAASDVSSNTGYPTWAVIAANVGTTIAAFLALLALDLTPQKSVQVKC